MATLLIPVDAFATGQFTGNPPNSGIQVSTRPLLDFVLAEGGDPAQARIVLEFLDSDIDQTDVDDDGVDEDFIDNNTRIQSFGIDIDNDGVIDFDVRGQNPNDLDVFVGSQEGDNIARLNGGLRIFEAGTNTQVDQLPSQNLYIANDGGFPPVGGVKPLIDQGSGTFAIGDPNDILFPCFVAGTLIDTEAGPRRVEDIAVGDLVHTRDHGAQPVLWHGSRRFGAADLAARPELLPVRISPGAWGNQRALLVSRQHRMLVSGAMLDLAFSEAEMLVPAHAMVGQPGITVAEVEEVTYVHLLFARHELIWAEGALSESFHPGETIVTRSDTATRAELLALFPELAERPAAYGRPVRPILRAWEARAILAARDVGRLGLDRDGLRRG
ncbi:MAG: Hint domain-containing protein [Pseudomonadota bacterium]